MAQFPAYIRLPDGHEYVADPQRGPEWGRDSLEEEILVPLVRRLKPRIVVEIGVWYGCMTALLAWNMPKDSVMYALDVKIQDCTRQIIDAFGLSGRVNLIEGDSKQTIRQLPDGLGFVYIDGDHEPGGVKGDYEAVWPKMEPNGIVAFHDVSANCGVRDWVPSNFPKSTGIYLPSYQGLLLVQKDRTLVRTEDGAQLPWPKE